MNLYALTRARPRGVDRRYDRRAPPLDPQPFGRAAPHTRRFSFGCLLSRRAERYDRRVRSLRRGQVDVAALSRWSRAPLRGHGAARSGSLARHRARRVRAAAPARSRCGVSRQPIVLSFRCARQSTVWLSPHSHRAPLDLRRRGAVARSRRAAASSASFALRRRTSARRAQPRVLLLDEPLATHEQQHKQDMLPYLARLRAELAIPMLYVSHHVDELIECDDLLVLEQGRLVATGPLPDLLARLDLTLAQDDDAGALIAATVVEHDHAYHVTQLALGTQRLIVGSQSVEIGTRLRLRVHARDVALGLEPPRRSRLLNIIAARIVEIAQTAQAGHVLVKLEIEGQTLLARITRKSAEGLALRAGMPVYALIKSVALMR